MPFSNHIKVLVWRSQSWQQIVISRNVALKDSMLCSTPRIFEQLRDLPESEVRRCHAVLIPLELAKVYVSEIDVSLPRDLHHLAAHTFAEEKVSLSEAQNVVSHWMTSSLSELHYSVMPLTLFEEIRQYTHLPLYSEAILDQKHPEKAFIGVAPFSLYQSNFLSYQEHNKAKRRLLVGAIIMIVVAFGVTKAMHADLPQSTHVFEWPWGKPMYERQIIGEALQYVRALPVSVRLNRTQLTETHVSVDVTGDSQDLTVWKNQWPDDLPGASTYSFILLAGRTE